MWTHQTAADSAARPDDVLALLTDVTSWPRWNKGVREIRLYGDFAAGAVATMVFPDGSELPFTITRVDGSGYEDLTEVPDAGVLVRVRHDVAPLGTGSRITYRCEVTGADEQACAEVGAQVTSDFGEVVEALARAAEHR